MSNINQDANGREYTQLVEQILPSMAIANYCPTGKVHNDRLVLVLLLTNRNIWNALCEEWQQSLQEAFRYELGILVKGIQ